MAFKIIGVDRARKTFERLIEQAEDEVGAALREEGEEIMTASKQQAPVDFGILKGSGFVDGPVKIAPAHLQVTLAYGGAAEAYALVQHERTDFRHTVGNAKYLERPARAAAKGMASRMKRRIRLRGR